MKCLVPLLICVAISSNLLPFLIGVIGSVSEVVKKSTRPFNFMYLKRFRRKSDETVNMTVAKAFMADMASVFSTALSKSCANILVPDHDVEKVALIRGWVLNCDRLIHNPRRLRVTCSYKSKSFEAYFVLENVTARYHLFRRILIENRPYGPVVRMGFVDIVLRKIFVNTNINSGIIDKSGACLPRLIKAQVGSLCKPFADYPTPVVYSDEEDTRFYNETKELVTEVIKGYKKILCKAIREPVLRTINECFRNFNYRIPNIDNKNTTLI